MSIARYPIPGPRYRSPVLEFNKYKVLTFDCYGTLIDWETGIWSAMEPLLNTNGVSTSRDELLELFGQIESREEKGPFRKYREILKSVVTGIAAHFGFTLPQREAEEFADSVRQWPPFPDSPAALAALASKYRLAVISNVDDDLFAGSSAQLGAPFDWVITAEQIGSYKPSTNNFLRAFERIGSPRGEILHCAQSLYHDIAPARTLGLSTVWVNRRRGKTGTGATPPADAIPDLEVPDMASLAQAAGVSPPRG
jgi:2-haloacid dehalogenase